MILKWCVVYHHILLICLISDFNWWHLCKEPSVIWDNTVSETHLLRIVIKPEKCTKFKCIVPNSAILNGKCQIFIDNLVYVVHWLSTRESIIKECQISYLYRYLIVVSIINDTFKIKKRNLWIDKSDVIYQSGLWSIWCGHRLYWYKFHSR